jgi:hypothetical protein
VGCREPIENKPDWGTYERPPNWIAWGLDVLEPPELCWLPTYCKIHIREIDVVALADDVRKLLTQMLLDRRQERFLRDLDGEKIEIT